jgi:hypothetical protein
LENTIELAGEMQHQEELLRQKYTQLLTRVFRINVSKAKAISIKVADWEVLIEECQDVITAHAAEQARVSLANQYSSRSKRQHKEDEVEEEKPKHKRRAPIEEDEEEDDMEEEAADEAEATQAPRMATRRATNAAPLAVL